MSGSRIAALSAALAMSASGAAWAAETVQTHGPAKAAAAIVAADRAFNERAASVGAGKAFGEVMDPADGLVFNPGADPIRGASAIAIFQQQALGAGRLAWSPSEVFASNGGDMGVTWGRWSFTPQGMPKPIVTGRYLTVWRKDAAGQWRGLIDLGQPDPAPTAAAR